MIWDLSYPPILFSEKETERGQDKAVLGLFSSSILYLGMHALSCVFLALIFFLGGVGLVESHAFMIYYSYTQLD